MFSISTPQEGWAKLMIEKVDPDTGKPYHTTINYNTVCPDCMAGDINMKLACRHVVGQNNPWQSETKKGIWENTISKKCTLQEVRGISMGVESLYNEKDVRNFVTRRTEHNTFKEADYAVMFIDPGFGASETSLCIACYGLGTCTVLWLDSLITSNLEEFTSFVLRNICEFRKSCDPHTLKPLYIVTENNFGSFADHVYAETVNMPLIRCFREPSKLKWGINKTNSLTHMYVYALSKMMCEGTIMIDKYAGTANGSYTLTELFEEARTQLMNVNDENGHIGGKIKAGINDDMAIVIEMMATCMHYIKTEFRSEYDQLIDWVHEVKSKFGAPIRTTYQRPFDTTSLAAKVDSEMDIRRPKRKRAK